MKLRFVTVCDNAFTDGDGRLNIIQIFDVIRTRGFPAIHPRLTIVTKWDFDNEDERLKSHKQELKVVEERSGKEIARTPVKDLMAESDKSRSLQYISYFIGMKFDKDGIYKIEIYMDGKKVDSIEKFEVIKIEGGQ